MTAAKSRVKSEARAEQGRRAMAAMDRDPVTGRIRRRVPEAGPAPSPAPGPAAEGGGAPAPAPFGTGPTHGFRARLRRRSASRAG